MRGPQGRFWIISSRKVGKALSLEAEVFELSMALFPFEGTIIFYYAFLRTYIGQESPCRPKSIALILEKVIWITQNLGSIISVERK